MKISTDCKSTELFTIINTSGISLDISDKSYGSIFTVCDGYLLNFNNSASILKIKIADIIIVVVLTLAFANDENAVNYFSFAGTLGSIILSVVAIFMTINSENESKDAKSQMDISIHRLEKTGDDISELSENDNPL